MPVDQPFQPLTLDTSNLAAGLHQFRVRQIDDTFNPDAVVSPLTSADSVGAIQAGVTAVANTTAEHTSGFPSILDLTITEEHAVSVTVTVEELLKPSVFAFLKEAVERASGKAARKYALEQVLEKVEGGGVSYYLPYYQISPNLTLSSAVSWIGAEVKWTHLHNRTFTNSTSIYPSNFAGVAKSLDNQPITSDTDNLSIGFANTLVGAATPRAATAGDGWFYPGRIFPTDNSPLVVGDWVVNSGQFYTGAEDGSFAFEVTRTTTQIQGTASGPTFDLVADNTLTLVLSGAPVVISLTSAVDVTAAQVVTDINTSTGLTTAEIVEDENRLAQIRLTDAVSLSVSVGNTSLGFTADVVYQLIGSGSGATFDVSTGTGDNTLTVDDDGTIYTVVFSDDAALAIDTVVSEINAAGAGDIATKTALDEIVLTSVTSGPLDVTLANTSLGFAVSQSLGAVLPSYSLRDPSGVVTSGLFTGVGQVIADGLIVTGPSSANVLIGDAVVAGVRTSQAKENVGNITRIASRYPYLDMSASLGAVQQADFTITGEELDHKVAYPQVIDFSIPSSTQSMTDVAVEEFNYDSVSAPLKVTLSSMALDTAVTPTQYLAPVETIFFSTGGAKMSTWTPSARITADDLAIEGAADGFSSQSLKFVGKPQGPSTFPGGSPPEVALFRDWEMDV